MNVKHIKITFIILVVLIYIFGIKAASGASAPAIEWERSFSCSAKDRPNSIRQTTDGGYIVAGFSSSNDGEFSGNRGGRDALVVKLNAKGEMVWQKSLGGAEDDEANCVQQTQDGGYIVAGASKSGDGDLIQNQGDYDGWVVKLNSEGEMLWQKSFGGSKLDVINSIQETADGGYIFAGATSSNDGDVLGSHGRLDMWIVKLDANGEIVWQRLFGGSENDEARSIQQTTDGGYIAAGYTKSKNGDVVRSNEKLGSLDCWVIKLDAKGNILWQSVLGGSGEEFINAIQQTADGGYIAAGNSNSNDGDITVNYGENDYWIVKLNIKGDIVWQKPMGGPTYDYCTDIRQTKDGGYIVAGAAISIIINEGVLGSGNVFSGCWIVKLDTDGNILWEKGLESATPNSIEQSTDGGYIIAHNRMYDFRKYDNFWIVKLEPETNLITTEDNAIFSTTNEGVQTSAASGTSSAYDRKKATEKLLFAANSISVEELTRLIQEGADVNIVDNVSDGRTLLMKAAGGNSNPEVIRILVENGVDINATTKEGWTPLMFAAQSNSNPEVIRALIEKGMNVNAVAIGGFMHGWTPLMLAAAYNENPEALRVLIEGGADVNAIDEKGWTPLIRATAYSSNPEVIQILIDNGAIVNAFDQNWYTPLMAAAQFNENPEILQILINNGAIVNAIDERGETSLMWAVEYNQNPEVLRVLIENGAGVNATNEYSYTPLMMAAKNNKNPEILRVLIEGGANINAVDSAFKWTPLMLAVDNNKNLEIVRVLIENGANVAIRDKFGKTALDYAGRNLALKGTDVYDLLWKKTMENFIKVAKVLLILFGLALVERIFIKKESKPDKNKITFKQAIFVLTIITVFVFSCTLYLGKVFHINIGKMLPVSENTTVQDISLFIQKGVNINITDMNGFTPLLRAVEVNEKPEVLRILIENGANVNAADNIGITPLTMAAVIKSNPETVRILIENGADVNATDSSGATPLMRVVFHKPNLEIIKILIENGADVNAADNRGWTPLMTAAWHNPTPEVIQILIESGANITAKNNEGRNALDYAEHNKALKGTAAYKLLKEKILSK